MLGATRKLSVHVAFGLCGTLACEAPEPGSEGFGTAEPITLDADVRVIATGQRGFGTILLTAAPTTPLLADDSGLYWYDNYGAVFGQRRGESEIVTLLPGVESLEQGVRLTMSLASSADRLFTGDAFPTDSFDYVSAIPPGRVWSIPKDGTPPSVLLESEDQVLVPLAAEGDRLIVMGLGDGATTSFYQVSLASPVLEPLALSPASRAVSVSDSALYWAENGNLLRAGLEDLVAEAVIRLRADTFSVCPGYVVSHYIGSLDTLVFQDAETGSEQVLPRVVGHVAGTACDARHLYIYGTTRPERDVQEGQLVRLDVESGQVARLVSPELLLEGGVGTGTAIVGDDAETLYIKNGERLLAVRKP